MSFYPQPDDWSCGPFALKHALVALGRIVSEDDIKRKAKTHWWSGTDEVRLASAARYFGCELETVRYRRAEQARKGLSEHLRRKLPALLCVDGWSHWITVLRRDGNQFVIVDSDRDPVLDILSSNALIRRWKYLDTDYDEVEPPALFDMLAVKPRFRASTRADFSVRRVRHMRHPSRRPLAQYWNTYLEDLLEICRPQSSQMLRPLSMAEFLRRNQDLVISRLTYWHGDIEPALIRRLLNSLRFVAETYGLVIPASKARRAVTDLAILSTMYAVTIDPIATIYDSDD